MNKRLFCKMFLSVFILSSCTDSNFGTFRIGVQPNEAHRNVNRFEKELEKRLGQAVSVKISEDYSKIVSMLKDNQIDMAVLSPLNFVHAQKDLHLKVLFKKVYGNSEFYYSAFILKKDSKIKSISDLKGKKIAFVDKNSTSGYLYPLVMLNEAGLSEQDVTSVFKGTHVDAVNALSSGEVDAAAVWANSQTEGGGAWDGQEFAAKAVDVKVLKYSDPIPNDAIVVKENFYKGNPDFVLRLMDALILMSDYDNGSLKTVFGVDKLATATASHYESVRKIQELLEKKK